VAISYETPEILSAFSGRMGGLSYPLLADPDSAIIDAFGVLNQNVPEDHEWYGMARPVTFIVDADGVVTSKYFEPGHRRRMTADSVLVRELGVGGGTRMRVETNQFTLTAYPAQDEVRRGNRVTLVIEIDLRDRMHLYAPGVEGYTPVSVALADIPYVRAHDTSFPESEILLLPAIGEAVPVFHGSVRILQDVTVSPRYPEGDALSIPLTFSYQACDDTVCYLPSTLELTYALTLTDHDRTRVPDEIQHKPSNE